MPCQNVIPHSASTSGERRHSRWMAAWFQEHSWDYCQGYKGLAIPKRIKTWRSLRSLAELLWWSFKCGGKGSLANWKSLNKSKGTDGFMQVQRTWRFQQMWGGAKYDESWGRTNGCSLGDDFGKAAYNSFIIFLTESIISKICWNYHCFNCWAVENFAWFPKDSR